MVRYVEPTTEEEEEEDEQEVCEILLDIPDVQIADQIHVLTATLTTPCGTVQHLTPQVGLQNTLCLRLVLVEPGVHLIDVKRDGSGVQGSQLSQCVKF